MTRERTRQVIGVDGVLRAPEAEQELNLLVARAFRGKDGQRLLGYLKSITINAVMGDGLQVNQLIHREGQRFIVGVIDRRIEHARSGKPAAAKPADPAAAER